MCEAGGIKLEAEEVRVIRELLKGDSARLLLEIAHTDHREYRNYLKDKEAVLERVIDKLCAAA